MLTVSLQIPPSTLFCFGLALVAAVIALVPRWRKTWGWGRGGSAGPISSIGWVGIVLAFLLMGVAVMAQHHGWVDPPYSFVLSVSGFVLFMAVGAFDSARNSRKKAKRL
ncbi:MAG: hypothetical protein QM765_00195 [Myxococcales bacterium]